jgi:hypothetical protein
MARTSWVLGSLALGALALAVAAPGAVGGEAKEAAPPFVVHEWGTFTAVQGADGIALEGLQHEEEALPDFVYSRAKVRECPLRRQGYKGLEVPADHVTVKMETPVLYFHAKEPVRARVRVDFVGGLITQWYPVSDLLGPPEGSCDDGPLDLAKVERSFLQWDVDVLPGDAAARDVPSVGKGDPWAYARNVDAAYVRTLPRKGPERTGPVETERFLFYRGLGGFALPFHVGVNEEGRLSFENRSPHAVPHVVALEVNQGGTAARWSLRQQVAPGERATDLLDRSEPMTEGAPTSVGSVLWKVLVDQGMNEDEAVAMVETWTRSWLRSEGLRVFYVVPRPIVDELLPLRIEPAPAAVERVLVGRIEVIDPGTLREVVAALRDLPSADAARYDAATARLARLGRFEEAHLHRVIASTKDERVRSIAKDLLEKRAAAARARAKG